MTQESLSGRKLASVVALIVVVAVFAFAVRQRAQDGSFESLGGERQTHARPAAPEPPPENALRVLFVGNSYTFYNDLPRLVTDLAKAAEVERPLFADSVASGGYTFQKHSEQGRASDEIASEEWDFVVLQEQSQRLSFSLSQREEEVYPFARELHAAATRRGAETIFFLTWARQDGDRDNVPRDTFEDMQRRLTEGYTTIARELDAPIAPVGPAWLLAFARRPGVALFSTDRSHPDRPGSYLAACVLLHTLYGPDVKLVGNSFTADLDPDLARFLQEVGRDACLEWAAERE
jgi:Domain of unknown function (DUF4886)